MRLAADWSGNRTPGVGSFRASFTTSGKVYSVEICGTVPSVRHAWALSLLLAESHLKLLIADPKPIAQAGFRTVEVALDSKSSGRYANGDIAEMRCCEGGVFGMRFEIPIHFPINAYRTSEHSFAGLASRASAASHRIWLKVPPVVCGRHLMVDAPTGTVGVAVGCRL
jgi:hypothetical protein